MAKAVVIAINQNLYAKLIAQNLLHKRLGTHRGKFASKRQHQYIINTYLTNIVLTLIKSCKQLRPETCVKHLTRQGVERDYQ